MTTLPAPTGAPRSAFGKLLRYEVIYAWRVPVGLLFGIGAPVVTLVILGSIPGVNRPAPPLGGLTYFAVYFPILIVVAISAISLFSLPLHLANYRELGILRRLLTTPVPPSWMLAAQLVVNLALAVLALGILVIAGTAGFGLGAPRAPGGFVLALVLSIAAVFAVGLWISAIARTTGGASGLGNLWLYPLLFFAGLWMPREGMPLLLRRISDWTPSGAAVHALQDSMLGTFPTVQSLLVLVAWALAFGFLAVRFFRWE
jgi:ABC-2 type transport system permease protein